MDFAPLLDTYSEPVVLAAAGLLIGILFGAAAQQSRFCLRAAAIEFSTGQRGDRLPIWLLAFSSALLGTQCLIVFGDIQLTEARQLASPQSLSGAALGGLLFGSGMVLARGCASRLLVLSATGNLRSLLSGLVFAVVAQASLRGVLQPAREWFAGGMTTAEIGGNDLLAHLSLGDVTAIAFGGLWLLAGIVAAIALRLSVWRVACALAVGACIPLAWYATASVSMQAFEPVQVEAVTFSGPSADTLMMFLVGAELEFDVGLVPGVFIGAGLAALIAREWKIVGFEGGASMRRYLIGAAMMGFGGMLAGGCAVGAGVTGASIFAVTAWVTLCAIWIAAAATHYLIDEVRDPVATPA